MLNGEVAKLDRAGYQRGLRIHRNTPTCPAMFEITPVYGCDFQCIYCNAWGQEEEEHFLPVSVDHDYPRFLESQIREHKAAGTNAIYYYSARTDCMQRPLLESGVTRDILSVLEKYDSHCVLVTKGIPSDEVFTLMQANRARCQVIISYGMPNESMRELLEPAASPLRDRVELARRCVAARIQTAAILEPLLPFRDLSFVRDIMKEFVSFGVDHFAVDFARVSLECLERIVKKIPSYEEDLRQNYEAEQRHTEAYTTASGVHLNRYSPQKNYMIEKFEYLKAIARELAATVSICNSFGFHGFNREAEARGYICMGINRDMTVGLNR